MEKILEVLKQHGKCTAREVAKVTGIEPAEAVAALLDLESRALTGQLNGYWQLSTEKEKQATGNTIFVKRTLADAVIELITEHGPMSSLQIAELAKVSRNSVTSALARALSQNRIERSGAKGSFVYRLPMSRPDISMKKPTHAEMRA